MQENIKKSMKYGLDIQSFSDLEGDQKPEVVENEIKIDYDKMAEALSKRSAAAEESALKGMLKNEGMSDEDVKQAIADFKSNKKEQENAKQKEYDAIIKENETYKQEKALKVITDSAREVANELGVKKDKFDKLMKLSDKKGFTKEDGKVDTESIKAEFEEQLKDLPEFLEKTKTIVITKSKGNDIPPSMSDDEEYRRKKYGKNKYYQG